MNFTPEQLEAIEAAINKGWNTDCDSIVHCDDFLEEVIASLTKPKWTPQEGEVVYDLQAHRIIEYAKGNIGGNYRPLTPDEVPALKLAIKGLTKISELNPLSIADVKGALAVLAKIKELTGEEIKREFHAFGDDAND